MQMRKMMAVVLTVALALMLALTGCGRKPVTNVLLNMLNGQYKNVTVTADKELETTLRRAVQENGTPEKTAQALEKKLGTTVSFNGLRGGQQGDHTFDLVFQTGSNTDAAARKAFQQWDPVFGTLPANGQYQAGLAMIQTRNGCYILVQAAVDRAGTTGSKSGKGSGQDAGAAAAGKEKETQEGREKKESDPLAVKGVVPMGGGVYVVETQQGFDTLMRMNPDQLKGKVIQLKSDVEFIVTSQLAQTFKGTLSTNNPKERVVIRNMTNTSLFGKIEGTVRGINVVVPNNLRGDSVGALASENAGLIDMCTATINCSYIQGTTQAGGLVGLNRGTITASEVILKDKFYMNATNAGGIAGVNGGNALIQNCTVSCPQGGASLYGTNAGGLAGENHAAARVEGGSFQSVGSVKSIGKDLAAASDS